MTRQLVVSAVLAALAALQPGTAAARTKLVTLPDRASMILNLQNPYHSLLTEEREITLQKGENQVDFAWQGVNIDPASIRVTILGHPGDGPEATKVISVAFPPNEAALTWQLYSPEARTERIRVSYLLAGIARSTSYDMVVNAQETEAAFRQYFQMSNASGENLANATIRLAQAADLSRSVQAGESRRFLSLTNEKLPLRKLFVANPEPASTRGEEGEIISMVYEVNNTKEVGLGAAMLDFGKARIFALAPDGSSIFVGEDTVQEVPVKETMKMRLGTVKDVLLKRRIMSDRLSPARKNRYGNPVLVNREVKLRYEVENFKDKAAEVRVVESIPPDARFEDPKVPGVRFERKSSTELWVTITLDPRPADPKATVPVKNIDWGYLVPNQPR